jgi:hypothetical protein
MSLTRYDLIPVSLWIRDYLRVDAGLTKCERIEYS